MIDGWEEVGEELEDYYSLFYSFWNVGRPQEDASIPTAAVAFAPNGKFIDFVFNPKFWKELSHYERTFVVSHEMLHLVLNHGVRMVGLNKELANIAMDVVVNEMLVYYYGFDREKISFAEELCWLDTVFPEGGIPHKQNFEYYYEQLVDKLVEELVGKFMFIDDASTLEGKDFGKVAKEIHKGLCGFDKADFEEELEELEENDTPKGEGRNIGGQLAGTGTGRWEIYTWQKPPVIQKWYKLFKKFIYISTDKDEEQWARPDRRFTELPDDLILPSEHENLGNEKEKVSIWLFLDISGSCYNLRHTFLRTYETIPKDKFDVRLFTFDTWVKEIDTTKPKIYGGGGTCFIAIEKAIQSEIKKQSKKYPKIVSVFTDGYGSYVQPEFPERWYWFLTNERNNYAWDRQDEYIPKNSHILKLSDYML